MTEQELIDSYQIPANTAPRMRSKIVGHIFYLGMMAILGGLGCLWFRYTPMPWWMPVFGVALGIGLGLWMTYSRHGLGIRSPKVSGSLSRFVFFFFFYLMIDFIDARFVPDEHNHFLFKVGFILPVGFGFILLMPLFIRKLADENSPRSQAPIASEN